MTILTLDDFITMVFKRFPPKCDSNLLNIKLAEYRQLLDSKHTYNYTNAYNRLVSSYKYQLTPSIDELQEILNKNIVQEYVPNEQSYITETLIVRKGKYDYEYGVKLENYRQDIDFFKSKGMDIIKLKYCDKNCKRCNYNHVCQTAKELSVCS